MNDTNGNGGDEGAAIGGAVRRLRERLGLRQGDLAKRTGMSAAQLCHIEKERNAPSVRTLRRIADALGVPLAELAADGGASEPAVQARAALGDVRSVADATEARFAVSSPPRRSSGPAESADGAGFIRSLRPVGATALEGLPLAARAQVRKRILEYWELERRTGVPTRPTLPLDYPAEIGTEDADALARAVRRAAGIADAVLFDSVELLENKGLRVVAADLPEGVDAFALWDGAARNAWLMVRKGATDERQQFRAACTLADVLRFVSEGAREPVRDTPWNRRFARAFAAAFLMPEGAVRETCYRLGLDEESWTWELLLREKRRYAVSAEAFAYRLEALGQLRPSLRQTFVRRARAWFEEHGTEPEPSHRKDLRHSRFSDLKLLLRAPDGAP